MTGSVPEVVTLVFVAVPDDVVDVTVLEAALPDGGARGPRGAAWSSGTEGIVPCTWYDGGCVPLLMLPMTADSGGEIGYKSSEGSRRSSL